MTDPKNHTLPPVLDIPSLQVQGRLSGYTVVVVAIIDAAALAAGNEDAVLSYKYYSAGRDMHEAMEVCVDLCTELLTKELGSPPETIFPAACFVGDVRSAEDFETGCTE